MLVVTETTTDPDGGKSNSREVWPLDAERRLNIEFTETMGGKTTTSTVVYKKKSQAPSSNTAHPTTRRY